MGIASKIIEIGAKLSVGRQIESEEVKCLRARLNNETVQADLDANYIRLTDLPLALI